MITIKPDDFAKAISEDFNIISKAAIEVTKKSVDKCAKETNKVIRDSRDFKNRTGDYVRHFRVSTTKNTPLAKEKTWNVAAPEYRKSHLLEDGHNVVRHGVVIGRAQAYPHIAKGAEYAQKRLEELITEGLNEIG